METLALTFKKNLSGMTLLAIYSSESSRLQQTLRETIKQAPMMFIGMQVVADITAFDKDSELTLDLEVLNKMLTEEGLNLVAVMSDRQQFREKAVALNIGALPVVMQPIIKSSVKSVAKKVTTAKEQLNQPNNSSKIVKRKVTTTKVKPIVTQETNEEPRKTFERSTAAQSIDHNQVLKHSVRSGQRIYSHGDLTIIGSVSAGAEVIADGNIHVYGALRGRAIAGAQGNDDAQIFCKMLDAELISIAGNYKPNDEINDEYRHKSMQISLENEKIRFLPL